MAFDACGTTRLEGDEIIKRLAEYLQISPTYLAVALARITQAAQGQ